MSRQALLSVETFLASPDSWFVLDVRSPCEYAKGHIPHSLNVPLLNDDERKAVGTTYKQKGRQEAVLLGWELVGPKMRQLGEKLRDYATTRNVLVYCARGGMRSGIVSNLLELMDLPVSRLEGGYKSFRAYIRALWQQPEYPIVILGGMTGAGKTEYLYHLAEAGESMVDLEGLANHKGSAFGAYGLPPQPTQQMFENLIGWQWSTLSPGQPVWIESESLRIGRLCVPDTLWARMKPAPVLELVASMTERMERLLQEYGTLPANLLREGVEKIRRRLGDVYTDKALEALEHGQTEDCFSILLNHYYDRFYQNGLRRRETVCSLLLEGRDVADVIVELKEQGRRLSATGLPSNVASVSQVPPSQSHDIL